MAKTTSSSFKKGDPYLIVYRDARRLVSFRVVRYDGPSRWWDWGINRKRSFFSKRIQAWKSLQPIDVPKEVHKYYGFGGDPIYYKAV